MKNYLIGFVLVGLMLFGVACSDLPDNVRQEIKDLDKSYAATEKIVADEKVGYAKIKASDFFSKLKVYAERENWDGQITKATARLSDAASLKKTDLQQAIDSKEKDKAKKIANVIAQLKRIKTARDEAVHLAKLPADHAKMIREAMENSDAVYGAARQQSTASLNVYQDLSNFVDKAKVDYPAKADDLTARLTPIRGIKEEVDTNWEKVDRQKSTTEPDWLVFAAAAKLITLKQQQLSKSDGELRKAIGELGHSYVKRLVDMKIDYYVQVSRTSWDEASDWDTEKAYDYKEQAVDEETFDYFDDLQDGVTVASYSQGLFSAKGLQPASNINAGQLAKLKVNPKEGWPDSSHDSAEFEVEADTKCYHKYLVVEDDAQKESGWEEVDCDFFEKNEDNVGMDIVSKPLGMYEAETSKVAAPPGMSFVGNPSYGQWKTGSDGNSFWEFYGKWMFFNAMLGNDHRYYRYDYDDYHTNYRGRRSYYGPTSDPTRYGTYSRSTQERYANRDFARSGKFRDDDDRGRAGAGSVRGSGPASRGRGPGGGGK